MSPPRNLKEWFDHHAASGNTKEVLAFPESPNKYSDIKYYQNSEIHQYALAAVNFYLSKHIRVAPNTSSVVAIATPGTLEWLATFIALARLGYCVLALSPRLSEEARSKLVQKAQCTFVITENLGTIDLVSAKVVPMISPEQLHEFANGDLEAALTQTAKAPIPDVAFMWHSSGSTGLPKLFNLTQLNTITRLNGFLNSPYGKCSLWIASSTYNSAGLTFLLGSLGKSTWTAFHNDRLPLTGQGLYDFLDECRPSTTIFTPGSLEMSIREPRGIALLQQTENVTVFGAVCPKHIGDLLVSEGIFFGTGYAMTETSTLMSSGRRARDDPDWDYMSPLPNPVADNLWFKPLTQSAQESHDVGAAMYELVVLRGLPGLVAEHANFSDPPGSFYTGDVFVKHASKDNRWKLIGRKDDQINMGIPVVVNAHEYEEAIKAGCGDVAVDEVVLFGQGREKLGVLVFAEPGTQADDDAVESAVWKCIDASINGKMKVGVDQEMIVLVHSEVPRTDKQNIKRAATYALFEDVINDAYLKANK